MVSVNVALARAWILTALAVVCVLAGSGCRSSGGTTTPNASSLPVPDVGGRIAFTRLVEEGRDDDICVVNTDGTGLATLAGGSGCQMYPRWSPDGSKIVFAESAPGEKDPADVWVVNADGTGKRQLTKGPIRNLHPAWSPDGKQIAYTGWTTEPGSAEERAAIFVMNADGSGAHSVTSEEGVAVDYFPMWTEDGKICFYRIDLWGQPAVEFSVNPDGSGLTRVKTLGSLRQYLDYGLSPDGDKVALQDVGTDRLEIVPASGTGTPVVLLDPVTAYLGKASADVAWSPNGRALAIAGLSDTGSGPKDGFSRLYIVNADGSGLSAVPGIEAARDPAWRPQ